MKVTTSKVMAAVLAAAAVPLFDFWTATSYLPSHNNVSLTGSLETEVQTAGDAEDHLVVSASLTNPSEVRGHVVISVVTACFWGDEEQRPDAGADPNCRRLGRPFGAGAWLDPDVTLTHSMSVALPPERPFVELRLRVAYARADRLVEVFDSKRTATTEELADCSAGERVDLMAPSRVSSLALEDQALLYTDRDGDGGLTYVIGSDGEIRCDPDDRFNGLLRYFSVTENETVWVGWPTSSDDSRTGDPVGQPEGS